MRDFFERQTRARRVTGLLILYFILCVILTVFAVNLAVIVFGVIAFSEEGAASPEFIADPRLFLAVTGLTMAVIAAGALYKIRKLSQGGAYVAALMGGREIDPATTEHKERVLLNVVEEMAIASGLPVPPVFVLDNESGINAFAAGLTPGTAVVAVTRGCLTHLNRDELQGVVAHEFSHIFSGDMRMNLRIMGVIHGLLVISLIGRVLMRTKGKKNPLPLLGLFLIIIGLIGVFFGRLIKAAVSRQREFLADAAAVQFTRNPDGIGGALKKIGGTGGGSRVGHVLAEEISHLYIANGLKAPWFGMLATHPPLEKRIRAIDPSFDGTFPTPDAPVREAGAGRVHPETAKMLWGKGAAEARLPFAIGAVLSTIGVPGAKHLLYAAELIASIPKDIVAATRDPVGARALVFALVMRGNPGADEGQFKAISGLVDEGVTAKTRELLPKVRELGPRYSLPLLDLCVPALSRLSPKFYEWFCAAVGVLVDADGKMDLFEFMLQQVLIRDLDMRVRKKPAPPVRFNSAKQVADECSALLSLVARSGQAETARAEAAFKAGCEKLGVSEGCVALAPDAPALPVAAEALSKLSETTPEVKKRIVAAAAACVGFDGEVSVEEAELLRAISAGLDVPVPPMIAS